MKDHITARSRTSPKAGSNSHCGPHFTGFALHREDAVQEETDLFVTVITVASVLPLCTMEVGRQRNRIRVQVAA